jgi:hypothetical protein
MLYLDRIRIADASARRWVRSKLGEDIVAVFKGPRKRDALSTNTNPCREVGQDSADELHVGKLESGHGRRPNAST